MSRNRSFSKSKGFIQAPAIGKDHTHIETKIHWFAKGMWWLVTGASMLFFLLFLTWNQVEVRGTLPQGVLTTGWFGQYSQAINFAVAAILLITSLIYFGVMKNKERSNRRLGWMYGLITGLVLSVGFYIVASLNWGTILPQAIVTAFIFLSMGAFVLIIKGLDDGVFNLFKLRDADVPFGIYGWEGATRVDVILGIVGGLFAFLSSLMLAQAAIIPPSILVAGTVSPVMAAIFGAAVVRFENSVFLGFIQKTIASWAVYLLKLGRVNKPTAQDIQDSTIIRIVAGLIALVPIFFIVTAFHSGLYAGLDVTLFATSMAFVIWGAITAWRGNTLAADIGHMGYNVVIGLLMTGTAGAIALV